MTVSTRPSATSTSSTPADHASPLFERIGGRATLERVVPDVLAFHLENPVVGDRFRAATKPMAELERLAIEFFATGLSGTPTYDGLSMPEAHAGMGVTAEEFLAVIDDILRALDVHGVVGTEQAELLAILYGMKNDIIGH